MTNLLEALAARPGCEVLRKAQLDDFLARNPRALLFFTGDVTQRPEGLDVAIVVRELVKSYGDRLRVGLIDRRDEAVLMARFGVIVTPAVAFVRDGQQKEVVARMREWPVFTQACERLLAEDAATAPILGGNP
jgi:hydrogenase-1 operon protein HyaE